MEPVISIINALIEKGDIWSAIAVLVFFWNLHKEISIPKEGPKEKKPVKRIEDSSKKEKELREKTEKELRERIDSLEKLLIIQQEEAKKLNKDISDIEKERISDLKEILSEYHATASETLKALEKFEFFITNSKGGKS